MRDIGDYWYRDEEYFFLKIRGVFRLATHN